MIVCITGMPGSGKSVAANIMKRRGFKVLEMGNVVREMMRKKGIKITNKSIREFALRLREERGRTAVASVVAEQARGSSKGTDICIVGIRSLYEIRYFRSKLDGMGMKVVAIDAPKTTRFRRLRARGRADDPKDSDDFEYREKKERRFGVVGAIRHADFTVRNDGTMKQLEQRLENVLWEGSTQRR